jgi:hypothetical protein
VSRDLLAGKTSVSVINIAAIIIGSILTLRKLVVMDRYHTARVILFTVILCCLLLYLFNSAFDSVYPSPCDCFHCDD